MRHLAPGPGTITRPWGRGSGSITPFTHLPRKPRYYSIEGTYGEGWTMTGEVEAVLVLVRWFTAPSKLVGARC